MVTEKKRERRIWLAPSTEKQRSTLEKAQVRKQKAAVFK